MEGNSDLKKYLTGDLGVATFIKKKKGIFIAAPSYRDGFLASSGVVNSACFRGIGRI